MNSTDTLSLQTYGEAFRPVLYLTIAIFVLLLIFVIMRIKQRKNLRRLHLERRNKRLMR
ncbi:MAG: hypothetical protein J7K46_01740 [Bacteroidales bacterium]|nr:hypothetical protein [Bacteroidales bacterium]